MFCNHRRQAYSGAAPGPETGSHLSTAVVVVHRSEDRRLLSKSSGARVAPMREWWTSLLEPDGLLLRDRALTAVDPDDVFTALRYGRLRRTQRGSYLHR